MDLDRFILLNQPVWDRLAALAAKASHSLGRLTGPELEELVQLYQRTSTHLSVARTAYRDPALTASLTGLVARTSSVVYGSRPRTFRALGRFFTRTFPAAVWHSRRQVAASAALFLVPALGVGTWVASSPAALDATGPRALREAYVNEDFQSYYSSEPAGAFASQVFTNNVQVAIEAFAGGIAFCVLTAFVLALNGASVGVAGGLFAAAGHQARFWGLILPHGMLETTAVFVAGAAGLRLGWALIAPGDRSRAAALAEEGRRAVVIVAGLVLAFGVAGTIEGFVTGSRLPTSARVGIGVASEAAFVAYIVRQGRAAAAAGATGGLDEPHASGWAPAPTVASP